MSEFDVPEMEFDSEDVQTENTELKNEADTEQDEKSEDLYQTQYPDNEINEDINTEDSEWVSYSGEESDFDDDSAESDTDMYEYAVTDSETDELSTESVKKKKERFIGLKRYLANKIYEFNSLTKKQKTIRTTVFSAIFIFVILVMTDIIPILPNSYHRSYVGNYYVLGETMGSDVKRIGDGVIYASEGTVICFGPDMKIKNRISTSGGIPQINSNGDSAVVYSKNGNDILVMKNMNKYDIKSFSENIYSAKVNSHADYILLTSEAGYKSCLSAYSSSHKLLYEWHTNLNILDMAFSDSSKYIVASTVEYDEASVNTKLIFIDTSSNKPVSEYELPNQAVSEVFFTDDNSVIAIGDMSATGFTAYGHRKWEISYADKNLKSYDYCGDGMIAFLFNKYNSELSESTIEIYSTSGKFKGKYESKENVRSVSCNNGYCLLLLDKGTVLLDDDADAKKTKVLKDDFHKVILYENYNFAFGIRDNTAEILSVKH
ncbi:MAG: hypothetical protein IKV88_00225 [Clostridia bacterium]|nr:hypothetical protein [Clostridia bacterium]